MKAKYKHTNIIAKDWQSLSQFYQDVFGCKIIPPERDLTGKWLDSGTGVANAHLRGVHLILPGQMENSREVLRRISRRNWTGFYLSLMSQYFPAHKACDTDLKRRISKEEYRTIRDHAWALGFRDGWFQDI